MTTATATAPLTARQLEIYRWIVGHWAEHGSYPSIREIGKGVGIVSPNGVRVQLGAIERKGWLVVRRGRGAVGMRGGRGGAGAKARGIEIPALSGAVRELAAKHLKEAGNDHG